MLRALSHTSLALLFASVVIASADAAWGQAASQPVRPQAQRPSLPVAIIPPVVELGAVEPGSTNPAKFTLVNNGKSPVRILDATPNCKCTAISDIKGKVIDPGATLELSASLAAPRIPGPKEAVVFITFEGGAMMQAKISGDVRFPVLCTPPYVDALKEVTSGTVKVRSLDGKPFTITRSGGKDPDFVGFTPGTDAPRAEYEIRWDLAGRACVDMPLWWFVWTDRAECPVLPLRVRDECTGSKADMARFQRFWIVKESLVVAGSGHNESPTETEIELEHYNPPKKGAIERPDWCEIKAVRSLIPGVEVKFVSKRDVGKDAAMVKIAVTASRGGAFEGEIEIETATGTGRVPFTYFATTW